MDIVDCIVIGAGVVGLAVARRLALDGREVLVLEAAGDIGTEGSSRNSEVIHAGIYYPSDWLKTRLCVTGRELLYRYCEARGVPHRRLGKLIVATRAGDRERLNAYRDQARRNGVGELRRVDAAELHDLEPAVRAVAGLLSPQTGIIDSHALMLSLQGDLEAAGGLVSLRSPFVGARVEAGGLTVAAGAGEVSEVRCTTLVNCAGLSAQRVAGAITGLEPATIPALRLAKGQYYVLGGRAPFRRLIYPLPEEGGLGIHVTLDLAGQARFGPDVHWVDSVDYRFDPVPVGAVIATIRGYYPDLDATRVQPGYTGIRPKLSGPGEPAVDFVISGPAEHGVAGLVNLYGIESPGLTACLAIADHVAATLDPRRCALPAG
jgi:L-2-hydroxyglutarate oxidase LhgO